MRTTVRARATVAALLVVLGLVAATGCLPLDADPSHVYVALAWPPSPTRVQNDTSYRAHVDSAEVTRTTTPGAPFCVADPDGPPTPLTFSTTIIPPGGSVPVPYFSPGGGTVTLKVHFTLMGAKAADGSLVTGVAEFTWVACPIK